MISQEKWKILTPLQKLSHNVTQFGQNNCCHRLWKVAQSAISRPIWSHCKWLTLILLFMDRALQTDRSITQLFFDRNSFLCFSNRPTDVLFIGPNRGNRFDETIKFSTSLFSISEVFSNLQSTLWPWSCPIYFWPKKTWQGFEPKRVSPMKPVWLDLAKFWHFCKIVKFFDKYMWFV